MTSNVPGGPVQLTIAVCSRKRPQELARALGSLLGQQGVSAEPEIIVVDNFPFDPGSRDAVRNRFPQIRYVPEPRPGLNTARNRALHEARGAVVAYLDDDAVAGKAWASAYERVFRDEPCVALCTGRVKPFALETPSQRLFESNGGFDRGSQSVTLPRDRRRRLHGFRAPLIAWAASVGNGSSFALRRELVLALGGFDERLDRGADLPGGGDLDLFWRVLQAGHSLRYEPQALAWHDHRRTRAGVHQQLAGHQRALIAWLVKSLILAKGGRARGEIVAFLVWRLCKPGLRLIRRSLGQDPLPSGMLFRIWSQCWRGLLAYPVSDSFRQRRQGRLLHGKNGKRGRLG